MNHRSRTLLFGIFVLGLSLLALPNHGNAQLLCDPAAAPGAPGSCGDTEIFPLCYICVNGGNECVPDDTFCDDGNPCTLDNCIDQADLNPNPFENNINGCISETLIPDPNLPIECYVCEPTENNIPSNLINNGICDRADGEDCTNSPDCQTPGETCIFPNSVPDPNNVGLGEVCEAGLPGIPGNIYELWVCGDGDVCTLDLCNATGLSICENPERGCNLNPDGCCPVDCVGPDDLSAGCQPTVDPNNCDPDCWRPQQCGDGEVQPPETCDDNANLDLAGIKPNGSSVTDAECRDQGTQFECTYCGDNIVQSPLEQCELNDTTACGGAGCGSNCLCQADICLEGSGDLLGGEGNAAAPLPEFCDTCSLNKKKHPQGLKDYLGFAGIIFVLGIGWGLRRRHS